ncbi:hypothetical protein F4779DRAFT_129246 [Xylariaceae sp. FL0662B]|nr:hypothetical protein F4779DRAFT_129246 [Xylariaceae sp. FL0662B]
MDDGLYILNPVHTHNDFALSYNRNDDDFELVQLDANLVRRSTFYLHKMANHNSHEIHCAVEDKSLRATAGGIDLGKGDSDASRSYRWNITPSTAGQGGYDITNVSKSKQKLKSKGPPPLIVGGVPVPFPDYTGPWHLIQLDVGKQNQDQGDDSQEDKSDDSQDDGDSTDGSPSDNAREIFREALKLIKFACTDTWTERTADEQESYVQLFKKFGRDRGVYP